jgi:hypothetical protein
MKALHLLHLLILVLIMKAILRLHYTSKPVASIRYYSNPRKVIKTIDGLNLGTVNTKPKDLADSILVDHHDPSACQTARTFVISAKTPDKATPEQLKEIDQRLERAFFDFKAEMGGASMAGWIHGNTKTRHVHGIFANSDGQRGLDIGPQQLSKLQDFFGRLLSSRGAAGADVKRFQFIRWLKISLSKTWPAIWAM